MIQLIPVDDVVSMSIWKEIRKAYIYKMKPTKNHEVKFIKSLNTFETRNIMIYDSFRDDIKKGGINDG